MESGTVVPKVRLSVVAMVDCSVSSRVVWKVL